MVCDKLAFYFILINQIVYDIITNNIKTTMQVGIPLLDFEPLNLCSQAIKGADLTKFRSM